MEKETAVEQRKAPVFEVAEKYPGLLNEHARFMAAGGYQLLQAIQDSASAGRWPWERPAEQTAQYGAFCAGIAWALVILKDYNVIVNNKRRMGELVAAASFGGTDDVTLRHILISQYGYTDGDFNVEK